MKNHVRAAVVAACLGIGLAGPAAAQTAEQQAFIRRAQLAQSRVALDALTEEILAIDREIERKVDKVVSMVVEVADSVDSGRKVANQKVEVMEGLRKTLDLYRAERQKRLADLAAPVSRLPREDLERGIDALDERIDRRVEQILQVSASLAGHEDVAKYERYYDDWDDGWWGDGGIRVSPAYRHNQRQAGKTARVQEAVVDGLDGEIARLERENDALRRRIPVTADPATRARLEEEVARNEATLATRRDQQADAATTSATGGRTLGSREATTLDRLIRDMVEEIGHDIRRLQALVNQRTVELQRLRLAGAR